TSLAGQRVLVTGGTTGIGRALVKMLVEQGARVLTFGRNQPELDDSLENARGGSGEALGLTADASTKAGVDRVFEEVDRQLGGLDVLVGCAALGAQPLQEMEEDDWRYVIEPDLIGYLACARRAIKRMETSGRGQLAFD